VLSFTDLPKPLAFVLSGGVALGAIQVGMMRAVSEAGIRPDFLIGSSVGAVNAAYIGQGFTETRVGQLSELWRRLTRNDVFGNFGFRRIASIFSERMALASPDAFLRLISSHVPISVDKLEIPVYATATDYLSGEIAILSKGDLRVNLLASCAIPFVFPPVLIGGRYLVDGSVAAHVPLQPAVTLGARTLVVFDVGFPCKLLELPHSSLERTLHVFSILLHRQPTGSLSTLTKDVTVIYLPSPCPLSVPTYDFSQGASLIQAGYETTRQYVGTLSIREPGVYGQPHSHATY
jgi:NTE family protein